MTKNRLFAPREPYILIKMFRKRPRPGNYKKLTQEALASLISRDPRTIREWESGVRLPAPESLMKLISVFVEQRIFVEGKEREEAEQLWESVSDSYTKFTRSAAYPPFDDHWFEAQVSKREQDVASPFQMPTGHPSSTLRHAEQATHDQDNAGSRYQVDWGEAMDVSFFYGREQELAELERWIVTERCRLVALLGMGGIGKSALAVKCARQAQQHFDIILWRSLRNAPSLEELLTDWLLVLSHQQSSVPGSFEKMTTLLLSYLRTSRCLLVLDNVEGILQGNYRARAGLYREGYEGYGTLLRLIGETTHQSCLVLTSREKPREFDALEGKHSPVRSLMLPGLSEEACLTLLQDRALFGPEESWKALIGSYAGNPLALKFVACTLREVFGGNIQAFLARQRTVFGDIRDLLNEQFERLSDVEKGLLYWLAIERDITSLEALLADMACSASSERAWESFDALVRHSSWVERGTAGAVFTLQPMIMEYVTNRFNEQVCQEIEAETGGILMSHALMRAQAREDVRKSQERLILKAVAERLLTTLGKQRVEKELSAMLSAAREQTPHVSGYLGANVLHLLIHMRCNLRQWDFSALTIKQAYLRGADLQEVSFAHCHFARSIFTEAFSNICRVTFSPDGQFLAAGTTGGEIRWWCTPTGEHAHVYVGHTGWVLSIAFNRDGSLLVSTGSDQIIKVWDVHSGHCLYTLPGHTNWVMSAAFSPDGTLLASGASDHVVKVWDMRTGACLRTLQGHTNLVCSVAFSPNAPLLASGGYDQAIRLWDAHTGQCLKVLQAHANRVRSITFSPHGALLASSSADRTIKLWDVPTRECFLTLQGHTDSVGSLAFHPSGLTLASGSDDQTIKLWDVQAGRCLKTVQCEAGKVRSLAFNDDGSLFATGGQDETVRLWNGQADTCLSILRGERPYERMNISGVTGLIGVQKAALKVLGAFEVEN